MFDFLGIGKTLKNFAAELSSVRLQIETLTREIEDTQYAPGTHDDVLKALEIWATENAVRYQNYLKTELEKLVLQPSMLLDKAAVHAHLHRRGILPDPSGGLPISRDMQMCGLLGPEGFVELMKKQMQALEWPAPGLPMADRPAAIAVLDKKIAKLRTRETELIQSAEKAGLSIS
jgi:hypothetical protein